MAESKPSRGFTADALIEAFTAQHRFWHLLNGLMRFRDALTWVLDRRDSDDATPFLKELATELDKLIGQFGNGATCVEDTLRRRELLGAFRKGLSREEQLLNLTSIRETGRLAVEPRPKLRLVK